jgi:hypothetical protein
MRYIDSGSRNPAQTLGRWLENNLVCDPTIRQVRWQSGFFSDDSLGYFAASMKRLRAFDGVLRVLIGSNDGTISCADVEALLAAAGPPRKNQRIGIVKFANAYFHPKTVHIVRRDGSAAAYVGSANLTGSGVSGLNIEAGILLDTRDGDDAAILAQIRAAIDRWFTGPHRGLSLVARRPDLNKLVKAGILPLHPVPPPPKLKAKSGTAGAAQLQPLLQLPKKPRALALTPASGTPAILANLTAQWAKKLTRSDAQRKLSGNQRGSITLVEAGHPINPQTYFRHEFFKSANWKAKKTNTGQTLETALIPFKVDFLGCAHRCAKRQHAKEDSALLRRRCPMVSSTA